MDLVPTVCELKNATKKRRSLNNRLIFNHEYHQKKKKKKNINNMHAKLAHRFAIISTILTKNLFALNWPKLA